jgi:ABC-type nickel/cobalt efflux system permease component RcnA
MNEFLNIIITISVLIVAVILIIGLTNMLKSGSANRSQKLMRLRIISQFIAIILIMIFFYFNY